MLLLFITEKLIDPIRSPDPQITAIPYTEENLSVISVDTTSNNNATAAPTIAVDSFQLTKYVQQSEKNSIIATTSNPQVIIIQKGRWTQSEPSKTAFSGANNIFDNAIPDSWIDNKQQPTTIVVAINNKLIEVPVKAIAENSSDIQSVQILENTQEIVITTRTANGQSVYTFMNFEGEITLKIDFLNDRSVVFVGADKETVTALLLGDPQGRIIIIDKEKKQIVTEKTIFSPTWLQNEADTGGYTPTLAKTGDGVRVMSSNRIMDSNTWGLGLELVRFSANGSLETATLPLQDLLNWTGLTETNLNTASPTLPAVSVHDVIVQGDLAIMGIEINVQSGPKILLSLLANIDWSSGLITVNRFLTEQINSHSLFLATNDHVIVGEIDIQHQPDGEKNYQLQITAYDNEYRQNRVLVADIAIENTVIMAKPSVDRMETNDQDLIIYMTSHYNLNPTQYRITINNYFTALEDPFSPLFMR